MNTEQTKGKKFPKIDEMTKEQIRQTVLKKRETNARAQNIVESLLEPGVGKVKLLSYLPHINQCHLEDVFEERAITRICGYPPCRNALSTENITKQQYRISIKTNKVYDISVRKSFCSNFCYKASCYLKKQMLTSPLWFREYEKMPTFVLMSEETAGSMGQEIDLALTEKLKEDNLKFTSINEFAKASFNEINCPSSTSFDTTCVLNDTTCESQTNNDPDVEKSNEESFVTSANNMPQKKTHYEGNNKVLSNNAPKNEISTDDIDCLRTHQEDEAKLEKCLQPNPSKTKDTGIIGEPNPSKTKDTGIIGEVVERPEKKIDPIITMQNELRKEFKIPTKIKSYNAKKEDPISKIIIHVEKCMAEWFTLDSMILLFGEAKVREIIADKGECIKKYLNNMANGLFYNASSYDQFQQICRKLNMLELEDHRYDSSVINREMKPLPDYSILKEESKRMELKVKAFLSGECETSKPNMQVSKPEQDEDPSNLTKLALVDKNAQNSLRRKILLNNLNKVLHDLQRSLNVQSVPISSDVRLLVNSFKLKANNIMFKPIQWTLIGIVVIKLLSLRDARLRQGLDTAQTDCNLQLLLLSFKQDGGYLDRLVLWLTDIDRLLNTSEKQLTIS